MVIAKKTLGRLSIYRRLLSSLEKQGLTSVYSHQLAAMAHITPAQVRRDIMHVGYSGSPAKGYNVTDLNMAIASILDHPEGQTVGLVGVGHLGRAILNYFAGRRPHLSIVACFDKDPSKVSRVIHGCRSYPMEELGRVFREQNISIGIVCVPVEDAQKVADVLIDAGVRGILNFAPVPIKAPASVYVEDMDMTMSLEKVAFYARNK